jgi:hypothetical protein
VVGLRRVVTSSYVLANYDYRKDVAFRVQPTGADFCYRLYCFLNVYALEIFLVLIIIEFLVLVELAKSPATNIAWRKNITFLIIVCVIVFAIILYQRTATILR